MMDMSETVITGALGVIFGAGGLGGLWTFIGKGRENEAAIVRQYYTSISERMVKLEIALEEVREENAELHVLNAKLEAREVAREAEQKQREARYEMEIEVLRVQVQKIANDSEASHG